MHAGDEVEFGNPREVTPKLVVILEIMRTETAIMAYVEHESGICEWANMRDLREV